MIVCILNSETKTVVKRIVLDSEDQWIAVPGEELAPNHDADIGWTWNGSDWIVPYTGPSLEDRIRDARILRDKYLSQNVDSLNGLRWELLSEETKQEYRLYREALLDVPQQEGFPDNIIWPVKPQAVQVVIANTSEPLPADEPVVVSETVEVLPADEPIVSETVESSTPPPAE